MLINFIQNSVNLSAIAPCRKLKCNTAVCFAPLTQDEASFGAIQNLKAPERKQSLQIPVNLGMNSLLSFKSRSLTPYDTLEIIRLRESLQEKHILDVNSRAFLNAKSEILLDYAFKIKSIPKDGKMIVVIGYPGAGKTTCVNKYGEKMRIKPHKYLNLDADDIKQKLPGYDKGKGASIVHEGSVNAFNDVFNFAMMTRCNLIVQTTGWPSYVKELVKSAKDSGYKQIKLVYVDVQPDEAQKRVVERFNKTKRFMDPALINVKNNYPKECFEQLINNKDIEKIFKIDNNGDTPNLVKIFTNKKTSKKESEL